MFVHFRQKKNIIIHDTYRNQSITMKWHTFYRQYISTVYTKMYLLASEVVSVTLVL